MTEFERIYRAYFTDVYRYALRLSRDEHAAEELTSETFFRALRGIDSFRGDCDIRVWLCRIAKNCWYSGQKKAGRSDSLEDLPELPDEKEPPEERIVRREEAEGIRSTLHDIPEPYKEVFMWRVFGELSFREIGELFSKSENWACVTYHRAKAMIRKRMEDKA